MEMETIKVEFLTRVELGGKRYEKGDIAEFVKAEDGQTVVNYLIATKGAKLLEKEIKGKKPQGGE